MFFFVLCIRFSFGRHKLKKNPENGWIFIIIIIIVVIIIIIINYCNSNYMTVRFSLFLFSEIIFLFRSMILKWVKVSDTVMYIIDWVHMVEGMWSA